jgi:hypothetical protein
VRVKAKQVADLQAAAANDRVESMLALRKIVNAEQAQKLMRFMHHAKRMHGHAGPGMRGRGPMGPGGPGGAAGPRGRGFRPGRPGPRSDAGSPDGDEMASGPDADSDGVL